MSLLNLFNVSDEPRQVADWFWIGGFESRKHPPASGWSLIVNCCNNTYGCEPPTQVVHCGIVDGDPWSSEHLDQIYQATRAHLAETSGPTLIHCFAGVSRSVCMSVYLLTRLGVFGDPAAALAACRHSHPLMRPKGGTYRSVLEALEVALDGDAPTDQC